MTRFGQAPLRTRDCERRKEYILRVPKSVSKLITDLAFFHFSAPGNAFLAAIASGPEVLYLLGLHGDELGILGEFWRKISLRIDGVHGG